MAVIDLGTATWNLLGWRPYAWRLGKNMEAGWPIKPDVGPHPATVPGSVQKALFHAGLLTDWHVGIDSLKAEWVEHRHWDLTTTIAAGSLPTDQRIVLDAQGLDYSGWLLIDGKEVAAFSGALTPHRFDLTAKLGDGKEHTLSIIFDQPPEEQGQIGYTSQSRYYKPRFNYSWDWCPRFVPIGVWDALTLRIGAAAGIDVLHITATLSADNRSGDVEAVLIDAGADGIDRFTATLLDGDRTIATQSVPASAEPRIHLRDLAIAPWWPNGEGESKTYTLRLVALAADGAELWSQTRRVGFKRVRWLACDGAPADALPWICEVNGKAIFLQGVNWTPVRMSYHDTTVEEYEQLVGLYKALGCNVLRVWGGAMLEKEAFYDAADRAGLLVWQEFPLSSSGIDNWPPEDPASIVELERIARSYVRRRSHHVSLLMWCGGNELQGGLDGSKTSIGKPVDESHPAIAALKRVVEETDPGRRFVPTSASGPRFMASAADFGKGLHHDVHGPWGMGGMPNLEAWRDYWSKDDSLFRSEVGMPSASSLALLRRYSDKMKLWPPEGEYWMHGGAWWTQSDRYEKLLEGLDAQAAIKEYIRATQAEQADALAIAAKASKDRFPRCGGFIVWMGHDCFPCVSNTSIIDFDRKLKPAAKALRRVFKSKTKRTKT